MSQGRVNSPWNKKEREKWWHKKLRETNLKKGGEQLARCMSIVGGIHHLNVFACFILRERDKENEQKRGRGRRRKS